MTELPGLCRRSDPIDFGCHPRRVTTRQGHASCLCLGRFPILVGLAGALFLALPMNAGAQMLVSGNDEKVLWDDAGRAVYLPPGKDTISLIDIGDRENPKILTSIALENSVFGPPTNLAVSPNGEIALVANSLTQIKDGEKWKLPLRS
jgi:hypothetical protein